jgi:mediator of RNA polymerase II transcription subunit 14
MQSSLARSVPALCVQSKHILSGAPAAEAAMPNIRVIPLNWWSEEKAQVSFAFFLFCGLNNMKSGRW